MPLRTGQFRFTEMAATYVIGSTSRTIAGPILLALTTGRSGGVYNIGARNERRNIDVVNSVLDQLGKPRSLIQFVKDRLGHDRRYAIDPSLAEAGTRLATARNLGDRITKNDPLVSGKSRLDRARSQRSLPRILRSAIWHGGRCKLRVLVTGCGGMLGQAVREDCEQRGDQVSAYDRQALDIVMPNW